MKTFFIFISIVVPISFGQCPTQQEREAAIDKAEFLMWSNQTFPSNILEIPLFVDELSAYYTEDVMLEIPVSGIWESQLIVAEYALLSRPFVGSASTFTTPTSDYLWTGTDVTRREYIWTTTVANETFEMDAYMEFTLDTCSTLINYMFLGWYDPSIPVYYLYKGTEQITDIEELCTVISGSPDGQTPGFCGPVDTAQQSVFPRSKDTTIYSSFDDCVAKISEKPLTCNNIEQFWRGDTIICRELHFLFLAVDPDTHCSHVADDSLACAASHCDAPDVPAAQCSHWEDAQGTYNCLDPVCEWSDIIQDTFLGGYACGTKKLYEDIYYAKGMCCGCDECAGIVQDSRGLYSIRKGPEIITSLNGESTIRREGYNDPSCGFDTPLSNTFLRGFACDDSHRYLDLRDAKSACCECATCGGVTCNSGGTLCTIREDTLARLSRAGEETHLKLDDQSQLSCLHLEGILEPIAMAAGISDGQGTIVVDIAPDLESVHVVIEYSGLTGPPKAMHIHEPDVGLKLFFLCTDDMSNPCEQTFRRGDESAALSWDDIIAGLRGNKGLKLLIHTVMFPFFEVSANIFCDGIPLDLSIYDDAYPCSVNLLCPMEVFACMQEESCVAWLTMYSFGVCNWDFGRDANLVTSTADCFARLSLPTDTEVYEIADNLMTCLLNCDSVTNSGDGGTGNSGGISY